jgi:transposase
MFSDTDLIVGVDVHRRTNVTQMMDGQGDVVDSGRCFANNGTGTRQLARHLARLTDSGGFAAIHIAAEATNNYWLPFFCQLSQSAQLASWPVELYPFNPRVVHNFKKALGDIEKTDDLDAAVTAERLRFGKELPRPFKMDELYLPLRALTRYRYHLVQELVRVKSYCLSQVYLKATNYSDKGKKPFSDVFGATSQAVLREFATLDTIANMPFDELVEWIDVKGKRRFPNPEENARKLQQVAHDSYLLPQEWAEVIHDIIALNLRHMTLLGNLIQRVETAITQQMQSIPNTLETIPGIGPVLSAGIIAEIGDLARFDYNEAKVASFAGLKWPRSKSADFEAEDTKMSRSGNRFLRYYLCEAAQMVRMHAPEYRDYYDRKYKEVRKHQHKRAIVLTARKLVRLVVRLLTTNEPYRLRRVSSDKS